ncbi:MAG: AbrB family transcriptional regulator [Alphaproteobacteria bacterium]|nr:AbrB family transcriptional regulator [Alphaproteobacteria bacterium]
MRRIAAMAWTHETTTRLGASVLGIAVGVAGGALFEVMGTPIPYLLGPLFFIATANLAGWRLRCLPRGREAGQVLIGTSIGLYFTPVVAVALVSLLPAILIGSLAIVLLSAACSGILARIAGLDRVTAYLGTVPGGMSEVLVIGDRVGAQPVFLTLAQVVRVSIVVVTVPFALTFLGGIGVDPYARPDIPLDWPLLLVLIGAAMGFAFVLNRLRVTNAWMIGSVTLSALLCALEIHLSSMPGWLSNAAQVLIGVTLGERFRREDFARAPMVAVGAAVCTIVMMAAAVALALLIARIEALPVPTVLAALAPGGLAEMSITAKVLGLGVPVVTAFHVARIFMITLLAMPIYRLVRRVAGPPMG